MKKDKILIADDERDIVQTLKAQLEANGYETISAYEGIRVVELAHKEKPDLILLDLNMPVGTGQTTLEFLRSKLDTEKIPIIVLTAMPAGELKEKVLAKGAQDFLQKPYELKTLLEKIKTYLA